MGKRGNPKRELKHKNIKHPIQPLYEDEIGTTRFKPNKIVQYLLDEGPFDLNTIAVKAAQGDISNDDQRQFAQLIGYSLGGFSELTSYVDDETYETAERMWDEGVSEEAAKIKVLEEKLLEVRKGLKEPIARLYGKHPDDMFED